MSLSLPEPYVGLTNVERPTLIEHAEQVQRNFEKLARGFPATGQSPVFPSAQRTVLLAGGVSAVGAIAWAGTGGWSVARTGGAPAGDYTITFSSALASANVALTLTPTAACFFLKVATTTTTVRYQTLNGALALADVAMDFTLLGPMP